MGIIEIIVAAVGGGALVKILELLFKRSDVALIRKEKKAQEDIDSNERIVALVVKSMADQRDAAVRRVDHLQTRIDHLELEINGLRIAQGRDPFPRWIVDLNGIYIFINSAFEDQFLRPKGLNAEMLIGKAHEDFWPKEIASKFKLLDEEAKKRPDGRAKSHFDYEGQQLTVYKIPILSKNAQTFLAFEGWITDIDYTVKAK